MYLSRRYRVSFYSENKFLFYYHRTLLRSPAGLLWRKVRFPLVACIIEGLSPTKSCAILVLYPRVRGVFKIFTESFICWVFLWRPFALFLLRFKSFYCMYARKLEFENILGQVKFVICYSFLNYVITERRFIRIRIFNFRCVTLPYYFLKKSFESGYNVYSVFDLLRRITLIK